jgi:hypothetical protein
VIDRIESSLVENNRYFDHSVKNLPEEDRRLSNETKLKLTDPERPTEAVLKLRLLRLVNSISVLSGFSSPILISFAGIAYHSLFGVFEIGVELKILA